MPSSYCDDNFCIDQNLSIMKKATLLLASLFAILFTANSQVKIGAPGDPDIDAVLELAGSSKGLLLPRIALTGVSSPAPLSNFLAGMVIYNTANVSDVRPGYYYSDGVRWIRISNSLETWSLSGNTATNPASQFLGTSDAVDLSMRTNNIERIRITNSGAIEIGTSVPNSKLKLGGSVTGDLASLIGLNGTITSTANNQLLYSIRNTPSFGVNFTPIEVVGMSTSFSYAGTVSSQVFGESAEVNTVGSNNFPVVAGVHGSAARNSAGATDGSYFGGYFRSNTSGSGGGNVNDAVAIFGQVNITGTGSPVIGNVGGLQNFILNSNPSAAVSIIYGVKNLINQSAASTVANVFGVQNIIAANSGAIFSDCYGTYTNFQASSGSITRAYGHYVGPVTSASIGDYRGIFIGNITNPGGARRAFEYAGTGTNDPVIINYDGSVMIGNSIPVTNAKLSIMDGHLQSGQSLKPTITPTASMGTSSVASLSDATDIAGIISLNMGTGAYGSGAMAVIDFNKIYSNAPIVIITPTNLNAATAMVNQRPYITTTITGFTINFALAPTLDNLMLFNYQVIETVNN